MSQSLKRFSTLKESKRKLLNLSFASFRIRHDYFRELRRVFNINDEDENKNGVEIDFYFYIYA